MITNKYEKKYRKRNQTRNVQSMLTMLIMFLSGLLIGLVLTSFVSFDISVKDIYQSSKGFATNILTGKAIERPSPQDWIKENQIEFYQDKVVIHVKNPKWATFANTNSMDPVLDENTDAIEIIPKDSSQIKVGDIVAYHSSIIDSDVIHRVIRIGYDENGWYAIMKGDNNPKPDPEKVRFNQIKRVIVALIY